MKFIKKKIYLISFIILLFVIIIFIITKIKLDNNSNNDLVINENDIKKEENIKEEVLECDFIYVDIKGEVINPGVYKVTTEDRVIDVINISGGLTSNADTTNINLAKKVTDEMVILVCGKQNLKEEKINDENTPVIENKCSVPDIINDASIINNVSITNDSYVSEIDDKINISTLTKDELLSIPGIGEVKANKILEYKNKYGLNKVDDLKEVDGIGNQTYEKIKIYFKD